jgi:predicted phosphoribosyltransferase
MRSHAAQPPRAQQHPASPPHRFADRRTAGAALAGALDAYVGRPDVIVLALPRGGVPIGYEVATRLGAPLDVLIVRKLGVPGHEEVAMGALASGDIVYLDRPMIAALGVGDAAIERVLARERAELRRRESEFRTPGALPAAEGRVVIVVDDGLATGSTMRAAVQALRTRRPARLIAAAPIAAQETCRELGNEVDEIVCLVKPHPFRAVSLWYEDFEQTTDEEVRALLTRAAQEHADRARLQRPQG